MKTMREKSVPIICAVLLMCTMWGVSGNIYNNEQSGMMDSEDEISGLYFMHGSKISEIYPCTFFCFDMEPAVDTTLVSFTVSFKLDEQTMDSLLVFGLMGADAGESGSQQFGEHVFSISLYNEGRNRMYAALSGGNEFKINLDLFGQSYQASGFFGDNTIELTGQYRFRNRSFAYDLSGVKVEFE